MARRKDDGIADELFHLLKHVPWWVGPALAVGVVVLVRVGVPWFLTKAWGEQGLKMAQGFGPWLPTMGWLAGGIVIVIWIAAEASKRSNRRLYDGVKSAEDLRGLTWHEFERLVTEMYRRRGYLSEHVGGPGDGGIDILLHGHGEKVLVQCKHWKAWRVGVGPVRELLGAVVDAKADRGVLVTSGRFTAEARRWAGRHGRLELVDGKGLASEPT